MHEQDGHKRFHEIRNRKRHGKRKHPLSTATMTNMTLKTRGKYDNTCQIVKLEKIDMIFL